MGEPLSDKELGKRLSAGRGYTARETTAAFARRIKSGRQEVEAWELGEFGSDKRPESKERKREAAIAKVHKASGLPDSFFRIDLTKLDAMAELWQEAEGDEPSGGGPAADLDPDRDKDGGAGSDGRP